jgi:hypothetical protein
VFCIDVLWLFFSRGSRYGRRLVCINDETGSVEFQIEKPGAKIFYIYHFSILIGVVWLSGTVEAYLVRPGTIP